MEPLVLAAVSRLVAQTLLHTSQQKTDEDEEVVVVAAVDGVELITQSAIAMLTLHFTQYLSRLAKHVSRLAAHAHRSSVCLLDLQLLLNGHAPALLKYYKNQALLLSAAPSQSSASTSPYLDFFYGSKASHMKMFTINAPLLKPLYLRSDSHIPPFPSFHTWKRTLTIPPKLPTITEMRLITAHQKRLVEDNMTLLVNSISEFDANHHHHHRDASAHFSCSSLQVVEYPLLGSSEENTTSHISNGHAHSSSLHKLSNGNILLSSTSSSSSSSSLTSSNCLSSIYPPLESIYSPTSSLPLTNSDFRSRSRLDMARLVPRCRRTRIGPPPQFLGEGADAGAVVGRGSSVLGGPAFALKDPWSGGVDEDEEERDIFFVDYAACKRRRILAK